ncbi:hypothetical protein FIBSPDRAFT_868514, partial [Athelia psychrophila]
YLSSCTLVARSWVWSSRSHQFRTLRFVYPRRHQQLNGLLGLIRSPLCTINDHVFEIDIEFLPQLLPPATIWRLYPSKMLVSCRFGMLGNTLQAAPHWLRLALN